MANEHERLPANVPGDFYVDRSCIDCDTCRFVAPGAFRRAGAQSYVHAQPTSEGERLRALMALVACPTSSIGTVSKVDARAAARAFPEVVAGNVHYCGFAAESSFGASSYLIVRPEGNVLVDSPRAAGPLLKRIEELGGVARLFLTHRDDVADHARFHERFGCERILHAADVGSGTREVERQLVGADPVELDHDLLAIPVPGHTRGSVALLYRETFLFTGDHLWADEDTGELAMGEGVCWYSWSDQVRSLERLLDHRFEWVLPGHERRFHAEPPVMRRAIERLLGSVRAAT